MKKRLALLMICLGGLMLLLSSCITSSEERRGSRQAKMEVPLKLYIIESGIREVRDFTYVDPRRVGSDPVESTVTSYLIEHPQGTLLWDTGFSDSLAAHPEGLPVMNGGSILRVEKSMLNQLKEIGYSPEEIDYLGLSHIHPDHIGNINYFTKSKVILQSDEFDSIDRNLAIFKGQGLDLEPYRLLREHTNVEKIKGKYDLFGDGSVVMLPAPGHSPGHQVLLVNLPETGPVILIGGLYWSQEFKDSLYVNPYSWDKKLQAESIQMVDELQESLGAEVWIGHDSGQHSELNYAPAYYE